VDSKTVNESEDHVPGDEPAKSLPVRDNWASRLIQNMRWRAYWRFPNSVLPPDGNDKNYYEQRDQEDNETSRVPEDEELRLRLVWGVELFGPAEAEGLCDQLRRLNWAAGFGRSVDDRAVNWVRHQRAYGGAGAWYNIGLVAAQGDRKRFLGGDNYASMPECVDYLLVRIYQLTPSLTCVLIGFVLKGCIEQNYETELNQDRKTRRERLETKTGISIIDPQRLKQRSIEKVRTRVRAIAHTWFSENLPGFFCNLGSERMPTAEFVTTKNTHLLPNTDDQKIKARLGWRNLVANSLGHDVWTSPACASLRFLTRNGEWRKETPNFVVALCTSEVSEVTLKHWGGHTRQAYVQYCHEHIGGILSNYAAIEFLRAASTDLKNSRAALAIKSTSRRKAVRMIEQIQDFFDRSLGTPAIVSELLERSKHLHYFKHDCESFFSPGWRKDDEQREFGTILCKQTGFFAGQIINEERSVREHFEQLSTVISVRESVRAQKRMEWLTIIAVAIATASLLVALPPTKDWSDASKTLLHGLQDYFQKTGSD